jgi:hypothetical protein
MSDPSVSPAPVPPPETPEPQPDSAGSPPTDFDIAEEYGTAKKNLPPAKILAICIGVVAVIVAVYALTHRAHAVSTGSIDDVVTVPMPGQDAVMVAINVTIHNNEPKPEWIKSIQVGADVGGKTLTDDAAPAVDAQRYLDSMPDLKQHALQLLAPEMRINPDSTLSGTVVASFDVKSDAFAGRKSLSVSIMPYDELPIVIKK